MLRTISFYGAEMTPPSRSPDTTDAAVVQPYLIPLGGR